MNRLFSKDFKAGIYKIYYMQKNPLAHTVASFIIPGLGQALNGDIIKGAGMFAFLILLNIFIYFFLNNPFGHLVSIAYSAYAAYDAYKTF